MGRCEAIVQNHYWNVDNLKSKRNAEYWRCLNVAHYLREGQHVCGNHKRAKSLNFVPDALKRKLCFGDCDQIKALEEYQKD